MTERDIEIVEVSPRDGLQNDKVTFSTEAKAKLIELAVAAGLRRLEATSFVNPKRVPQMADADQLMAVLPRVAGVSYIGLVMNQRGLEAVTAELKRRDLIGRLNGPAGADKPKAKAGPVDDWSPILPVPDGTPEPAFTPPTR